MDRVLTCSCGEKIVVSRAQAGQNVACPKCAATNKVPTLRGLNDLPAAESATTTAPPTKSDTWQYRGPVLAVCFGLILICGGYAAMQFYDSYGTRIPYSAASHIKDDQAAVDQLAPDALLHLWDTYSSMSLGPKRPPDYKVFNDYSSSCLQSGIIASSIASVAAIVAGIAIFSAGKKKQTT